MCRRTNVRETTNVRRCAFHTSVAGAENVFLLWHKHHVLLDTNDDLNPLTRNRADLFTCYMCALCEWCVRFGIANDFNQIVLSCISVAVCLCVMWFFPFLFVFK